MRHRGVESAGRRAYFRGLVLYHFLDKHEDEFVVIWPSVRDALLCMARCVPLMHYEAGLRYSSILLASDARGADSHGDVGAFGITISN